eukprot:Skav219022  [mRNA]  locus=scaffold2142:532419:534661:+ [translate_table: standard]
MMSSSSWGQRQAYVHLRELALLAKEAGVSTQDFANVEMKVSADDHGEHRIYNVEVIRPEGLDKLYADQSFLGCDGTVLETTVVGSWPAT